MIAYGAEIVHSCGKRNLLLGKNRNEWWYQPFFFSLDDCGIANSRGLVAAMNAMLGNPEAKRAFCMVWTSSSLFLHNEMAGENLRNSEQNLFYKLPCMLILPVNHP